MHFPVTLTSVVLLSLLSSCSWSSRQSHLWILSRQSTMKNLAVLTLCAILLLSTVDAQRNRRPSSGVRGGTGGRGSGGPAGIRYPTDEEERTFGRPTGDGSHVGKWPGGFYGGH